MPRGFRGAHRDDSGFTLVELLIVIVILGVLAGVAVFGVAQFRSDASITSCEADMQIVISAASAYELQRGAFPATLNDLEAAGYVKDPSGIAYTFDAGTKTVNQGPCNL